MSLIPALALPPPPTTNTRTEVTPAGTVHSQVPTSLNVRTVSLPTAVEVEIHSAANAGIGIETNNPEIKTVINAEMIFERAAIFFVRTTSNFIFTSLLALSWGEAIKIKWG
jgi:hypothetical protein